ncbi:hypothetical protein ACVI1L_004743 [Bradyrhizobium sp. USDA 4516]|nr:hypothetical protein [Bradyrhizobium sp. USDA 4541]
MPSGTCPLYGGMAGPEKASTGGAVWPKAERAAEACKAA